MKQSETITAIPSDRLQFFPIMMFAVVMGFSGLSLVFTRLAEFLYFPSVVAVIFTYISTALFFVILFFYGRKLLKYKEEVIKELSHPIRVNFFCSIIYFYAFIIFTLSKKCT